MAMEDQIAALAELLKEMQSRMDQHHDSLMKTLEANSTTASSSWTVTSSTAPSSPSPPAATASILAAGSDECDTEVVNSTTSTAAPSAAQDVSLVVPVADFEYNEREVDITTDASSSSQCSASPRSARMAASEYSLLAISNSKTEAEPAATSLVRGSAPTYVSCGCLVTSVHPGDPNQVATMLVPVTAFSVTSVRCSTSGLYRSACVPVMVVTSSVSVSASSTFASDQDSKLQAPVGTNTHLSLLHTKYCMLVCSCGVRVPASSEATPSSDPVSTVTTPVFKAINTCTAPSVGVVRLSVDTNTVNTQELFEVTPHASYTSSCDYCKSVELCHHCISEMDNNLLNVSRTNHRQSSKTPKPPWLLCTAVFSSWSGKMQLVSGFLLEVSPWCHSDWICLLQSNYWREVQWKYCELVVKGNLTDEQSVCLMHGWKPPWVSYVCRNISGHHPASSFVMVFLGINIAEVNWKCMVYISGAVILDFWRPVVLFQSCHDAILFDSEAFCNSGKCCSLGIYFNPKLAPCTLISIMTFLQHRQSKRLKLKPPWWLLVWVLGPQEQDLFTWLLLRRAGTVIQFVFIEKGSKYRSFLTWPHKMLKWFPLHQGALMVNGLRLHQLVQDGNTIQIVLIFLPVEIEKHIKSVTVASDVQGMLVHQPLTFSFSEIINLDDLVMSASPLCRAAPVVYFLGSFMVLSMLVKLEPWPLSPAQYTSTILVTLGPAAIRWSLPPPWPPPRVVLCWMICKIVDQGIWNSSHLFTEGNITVYVHFSLMISTCQVLLESDTSLHLLWHFTAVQQQLKSFAMLLYLCFFITDYCDQLSYWHLACLSMAQLLFMGGRAQLRLMLLLFFCFLLAIVQGTKHFPLAAVQRTFSWPPFVIGNITRREDLCPRFWCSSQCNQVVMFVRVKALWLPPGWVWSLRPENYSLQLISLWLPDKGDMAVKWLDMLTMDRNVDYNNHKSKCGCIKVARYILIVGVLLKYQWPPPMKDQCFCFSRHYTPMRTAIIQELELQKWHTSNPTVQDGETVKSESQDGGRRHFEHLLKLHGTSKINSLYKIKVVQCSLLLLLQCSLLLLQWLGDKPLFKGGRMSGYCRLGQTNKGRVDWADPVSAHASQP